MGCDIHLHVEVKAPEGRWSHALSQYCPRNYVLFGHLAGVRHAPLYYPEPQGFPKDASYQVIEAYTEEIVDDEEYNEENPQIRKSDFEKYLEKGYVKVFDERRIVGRDWHTASHLNFWTFEMQLSRAERESSAVFLEYQALANYMNTFESVGRETRVVFWFDN